MDPIALISGPPAAGKSTVARRVAEGFPRALHLQVDQLREMMVSGLLLPAPGETWSERHTEQFRWARSSACAMARTYARAGVRVVIDDVSVPASFAEPYAALDDRGDGAPVVRILLLPRRDALLARLERRGGPFDEAIAPSVPWLYGFLETMDTSGWTVLDTSDWSVETTVERVRGILAAGGASPGDGA